MTLMVASTICDTPYDYECLERPKRDVVFVDKDPHQDKGVCSKKIRKGAGKRLSRAERKK